MSADAPAKSTDKSATKVVAMQLKKNYAPRGPFRVVGYQRPEIRAKDAGGREQIVQTAAFIDGEMTPAKFPGVGFANKVWSGTVIEVPEDEAKAIRAGGIGEVYL